MSRLFYRLARRLARILLKVFFRMKIIGSERVPPEGPLVVVANHESFLDPFIVGSSLMKRFVTFLAAPWLYEQRVTGWFLRRVGAVQAYGGGSEVTSLRGSIRHLRSGGSVGLFPQGGIGRDGIAGGAVFMALKGGAPILPMRIMGAGEALPLKRWWPSLFTKITVDIEPLITAEDLHVPGQSSGEAVERGVVLLEKLFVR